VKVFLHGVNCAPRCTLKTSILQAPCNYGTNLESPGSYSTTEASNIDGHRYRVVLPCVQSMVTANELIPSLIASQGGKPCAIVVRFSIELLDEGRPRHGPRPQGFQVVRASSPQLNSPFFGLGAICRFTLDSTTPADLPCRRSVGCSSQSAFCSSSLHKARSPSALGISQGKSRSEPLGES